MATKISRKIAVILATDVVGYSKHMEENENEAVQTLRSCEKIFSQCLKKYEGKIFNTGGDSFFAEFKSAVSAVECGVEFQKKLENFREKNELRIDLKFRIGINMGDVVLEKKNLLGDGVNIAARLESLCQPNGISVSKSIYDLVNSKLKLPFIDLGIQKVKNNEFHAYDVLLNPSQKRSLKTAHKISPGLIAGIICISTIMLFTAFYFSSNSLETTPNIRVNISDKPSILIMPLENQTGNKDDDYIGAGITSNIVTTLSQNDSIFVPSGNTGKYAKDNNFTDNLIKKKYGVQYILRGDVQGLAGAYRVGVQMTDLNTAEVIWSQYFNFEDNKEIFDIQDNISLSIMEQLSVKIRGEGIESEPLTKNPEAYKKHLNAWAAFGLKTAEGSQKAERLWKEAIALDPSNPRLAFVMAWVHWRKVTMRISEDPKKDMVKAYEIATQTSEKFDDWVTPKALAGLIELYLGDHEKACKRIPNLLRQAKSSSDLSMSNLVIHSCGELSSAIENYEKIMLTNPHHAAWIYYMYVHALIEDGQLQKAEKFSIEKLKEKQNWRGVDQTLLIQLAYIYEKNGNKKKAKKMFLQQKSIDGKGKTGEIILKEYITARDKSYLNDIIKTLEPYGLAVN